MVLVMPPFERVVVIRTICAPTVRKFPGSGNIDELTLPDDITSGPALPYIPAIDASVP